MLCNQAEVLPDGRVNIGGGAPEFWSVPTVPWTGAMPVVVICDLEAHDDPQALGLEVVVVRLEDDVQVGGLRPFNLSITRDPAKSTGATPVHVPLAGYLDVTFDRVGLHAVLVRDGSGLDLAGYVFGVLLKET